MKAAAPLRLVLAALLIAASGVAAAQGVEVHGENSVFAGHGVVIAWGVLRAAVEDETRVVMRIAPPGHAYAYVGVEAVDPFTRARRPVLPAEPLGETLDVRSPRTTFGDFPRREVRLYRTAEEWRAGRPALTVYYLGVPDTAPEFASEAALLAYLAEAVAKARPAAGRPAP